MLNQAFRMLALTSFLVASAASVSATQIASDPAAAPVAAPASSEPEKPAMICRSTRETGSHLAGKAICHTRAQWTIIDNQNRASARDNTEDPRFRPIQH